MVVVVVAGHPVVTLPGENVVHDLSSPSSRCRLLPHIERVGVIFQGVRFYKEILSATLKPAF